MRIYAQRPGRVLLQVLADVSVLAWVVLVVVLARAARSTVLTGQLLARRVTDSGTSISQSFDAAARSAGGLPLVGGDLSRALSSVTSTGESLSRTGHDLEGAVAAAAGDVANTIVLVGVVPVVVVWLALRLRWVLAARSAGQADPDLLALNALTRRPMKRLGVVPNPADGWRRGDAAVVSALAEVELAALGLRVPRSEPTGEAAEVGPRG